MRNHPRPRSKKPRFSPTFLKQVLELYDTGLFRWYVEAASEVRRSLK